MVDAQRPRRLRLGQAVAGELTGLGDQVVGAVPDRGTPRRASRRAAPSRAGRPAASPARRARARGTVSSSVGTQPNRPEVEGRPAACASANTSRSSGEASAPSARRIQPRTSPTLRPADAPTAPTPGPSAGRRGRSSRPGRRSGRRLGCAGSPRPAAAPAGRRRRSSTGRPSTGCPADTQHLGPDGVVLADPRPRRRHPPAGAQPLDLDGGDAVVGGGDVVGAHRQRVRVRLVERQLDGAAQQVAAVRLAADRPGLVDRRPRRAVTAAGSPAS